jgi:uncharacterized protein with ATP-grasp and redox domains
VSLCVVGEERCTPCSDERAALRAEVERLALDRDQTRELLNDALALISASHEREASARLEAEGAKVVVELLKQELNRAYLGAAAGKGRV